MSTVPVSHLAYQRFILVVLVPEVNWIPFGKYQSPRLLPLPPSPTKLSLVPQQSGLGGVPQQVTSSVTQYRASSASPMTDGSRMRTPWLGNTAPFRARPGPVCKDYSLQMYYFKLCKITVISCHCSFILSFPFSLFNRAHLLCLSRICELE